MMLPSPTNTRGAGENFFQRLDANRDIFTNSYTLHAAPVPMQKNKTPLRELNTERNQYEKEDVRSCSDERIGIYITTLSV